MSVSPAAKQKRRVWLTHVASTLLDKQDFEALVETVHDIQSILAPLELTNGHIAGTVLSILEAADEYLDTLEPYK